MKTKIFVRFVPALFVAFTLVAHAQQPAKIPRIGYLTGASLSAIAARAEAFRQGLRELGYVTPTIAQIAQRFFLHIDAAASSR